MCVYIDTYACLHILCIYVHIHIYTIYIHIYLYLHIHMQKNTILKKSTHEKIPR